MEKLLKGLLTLAVGAFILHVASAQAPAVVYPKLESIPDTEQPYIASMPLIEWTPAPTPIKDLIRPSGLVPEKALRSCIEYAKWWFPKLAGTWGNAWELRGNTESVDDAEIIITHEGPGHVVVKQRITASGSLDIWEGNLENDKDGSESNRQLLPDDPRIKGLIDLDLPAETWKAPRVLNPMKVLDLVK